MVVISRDLWNTLFSWMSGQQCFLPEGCDVPLQGVLVYVAILMFFAVLLYWFRAPIVRGFRRVVERIPNPLS